MPKCRTGVTGLDEITGGGLPRGRPTLVCGGPGCGKTVLAMEFLVRGALEYGEPGLFVTLEESVEDLRANFLSLGFDLEALSADKKLRISHIRLSRGELTEAGQFTLDGLLVRIGQAIEEMGAKRVALDTLEALFYCLGDSDSLRSELARMLAWLKAKQVTVVLTGERGASELTRHGFEEYVSDCVLLLDHRVVEQISKRRLRIVKYRGSAHGKDEYPFSISTGGFSVLPITSVMLEHESPSDRVSMGVAGLDRMLGGEGVYRGSRTIITGTAGTGKSTLAAAFAESVCKAGESCLYLAFEEPASQLIRNMRSVGIDLEPWCDRGNLVIQAFRPSRFGLEEHLLSIQHTASQLGPRAVVIDPVSNFISIGNEWEVKSMMMRVLDLFKNSNITVLLTSLTSADRVGPISEVEISSLMDTWIALGHRLQGNTYTRQIHVLKSRGVDHSRELSELVLSSNGISIRSFAERPAHER